MTALQRHAVTAATVFDGTIANRNWAVLVEGNRIAWVGHRRDLPADVPVTALPGDAWLAPGFIDVQVNGGGDVLLNDRPTPEGMLRIAAAHRRYGTTGLFPTLISDTPEQMRAALQAAREVPLGSGVLGIHLEGPYLSPERPGAHDPAMLRVPSDEDLELLTSHASVTLLVTLAPERVPNGCVRALVDAGVRVSLGHSMATYDQAKHALTEGMTGFTHLFNAMRPLSSRDPGPIAAALETPDAYFGMIVDGAHVHPSMLRLATRGLAHPMLVTDAMPPVGGHSETFRLNGRIVQARGEYCVLPDETLAGTALDMASAVRNCVRLVGTPLGRAISYATLAPARFMGMDDQVGRLAVGLRADMVALEPESVRVLGTWIGGRWQSANAAVA